MTESDRFDPMILESRLYYYRVTLEKTPLVGRADANVVGEYPCMETSEAGAMGSSPLDLTQSPEQGNGTGTQVGEEHGPGTLTQPIGNGRTGPQQEQQVESPVSPSEGSKKRKDWSEEQTDLLLPAVLASEKTRPRSRLNNELKWDGVAKAVPGRTGKQCRMRMETLKKSYNAVKDYCDKEEKEFADLNEAELRKMKLATRINESWYNQIRDHCAPSPAKRSRAQGPGTSSTSGEVGLMVGGLDNSGIVCTDVATASGPAGVSHITAASAMVRIGGKSSEAWNGRLGELLMIDFRSERRHGAPPVVWVSVWCG